MTTLYQTYVTGLRLSHRALTRNLERFAAYESSPAPDRASLAEYVRLYGEFLDVHHDGEDRSIFPALRRHTAGRSTDAAHLDRWGAEHHAIERLGDELAAIAARDRATLPRELATCSRELLAVLQPHAASEEEILTTQHLAEMIPAPDLAAAVDEIAKANRSRALRMASFLASSLDAAERRELFGEAPWLFRRVLLPLSERRMRRFHAIVHPAVSA